MSSKNVANLTCIVHNVALHNFALANYYKNALPVYVTCLKT